MRLLTDLARSPIARRLVPIAMLCLVLPVFVLVAAITESLHERENAAAQAGVERSAGEVAAGVAARVDAADALAATLVARGGREPLEVLRRAAVESGMFLGVLAGDADGAGGPAAGPLVVPPSASEPRGTVLLSSPARTNAGRAWLVRRGRLAAREVLLYFELAPQWLWSPHEAPRTAGTMIVDARSTTLLRGAAFPAHATGVVIAHVAARPGAPVATERVAWQAEGGEWRGALVPLPLSRAIQVDAPWRVASAVRVPSRWQALEPLRGAALAATALSLLLAAGLATLASLRYRWGLMELQRVILRVGTSRFTPVGEEARLPGLIEVVNAVDEVGARVYDDVVAFETLGEIDQLLLGATELEPVLDAILKRVTTVTRCQSAGIALLDSDSPALGRVYVAARDGQPLPVARVEFDLEVVEHLAGVGEGVTIARCEEVRHSFLRPMRDLGSEFFWVWPVNAGERLVAVLAAGFGEEPVPDPRFARHGSEFASRLAVALSKTARDEHLYRQAHFDPLTSLPNRLLFRDRLAQELANAQESHSLGALLYIDLDHFKKVNDSVGHAAGDQLLQIVSQRLRACVKEGDTVARLAGDEFTVILRNVADPESAALVAERVIESLKIPINVAGRDHHVPASIGITLFPNDGTSIEELTRNADGAMYRAKNQGRSRAMFFDRRLMTNRFDPTHSGLHRALRRREFSLFYQPQFRMTDGALVGVEALLRWQTPRDGTRSPVDIIPAAEASGLIVDIGGWVLESACAQLALWREQGIAPPRVSVNVSVQQLKYAEFTRNVRRILDKHGILPELIEIEMTESVFADEAAGAVLRQLADLGVRLALDDFGTGYSSLNYLRQHPIKVVKIDRSFLEDLPMNQASATLAETIITMAHALGKEVVAEGVETEEQMQFLRERRCDHAQGFYLAQPMPVPEISEMLASRRGADSLERLRDVG